MDSFFSLFDPSEGGGKQTKKKTRHEQDNVKKKADGPKGRRRGRKSHGKNETLPEESSFLCEPALSTDLLVKDGSYIENYFEVNKKDDDQKDDRKPKRRNSARKTRRKKNKISPSKDLPVAHAWTESHDSITNWNNQSSIPKICDETIGKNVNDLTKDDFKSNYRKEDGVEKRNLDETVYKVIDKLEKVGLKDDTYAAGDFNTEELENDFFYSSDDLDDSFDDTASEPEDSSEEVYGSLPPEPRFGNVEYKLQLVSPCERRFQHLVTQLKWRLRSGGGSAVYVLGVRDCGALRGLRAKALRASLHSLRRMARALSATLTHVTARRVAPHRAVAEVYIRKLADAHQSVELRVAVMGANEAGKSTLIGVLTQGELDNGRGSARLNMFRHLHEVKSGRTSSLSHEILGFDAQGNVVNYGCSELMTAERIGERSAKLVSFLDLAGHSKYQRTTLHGLSGYCPHRAMIVISATAGITRMTEEHLALVLALRLPFCAVVAKCDVARTALQPLLGRLQALLAGTNKKPVLITDENMARNCVGPQKLILDTIDNGKGNEDNKTKMEEDAMEIIPVFPVSCVRGSGLNALHAYLLALQPPDNHQSTDNESCEFQIDEIFHVGESTGHVVGGLMARGQLYEGDNLIIGPFENGEFEETSVLTIYRNRSRCFGVAAGHAASLGLCPRLGGDKRLRPGMVLLARSPTTAVVKKRFGECDRGHCKMQIEATDIIRNHQLNKDKKNKKNVRRRQQALAEDIAVAEQSLSKPEPSRRNLYLEPSSRSESEEDDKIIDREECICQDTVLLEDPNDPRGCIFFQASVHILRHSTAICPGFQCTVHVGNVRQTAIIEGILSRNSEVRAGSTASLVFRFTRYPEYLVTGRRLLLTAGQGTRGIGRVTQVFPYVP